MVALLIGYLEAKKLPVAGHGDFHLHDGVAGDRIDFELRGGGRGLPEDQVGRILRRFDQRVGQGIATISERDVLRRARGGENTDGGQRLPIRCRHRTGGIDVEKIFELVRHAIAERRSVGLNRGDVLLLNHREALDGPLGVSRLDGESGRRADDGASRVADRDGVGAALLLGQVGKRQRGAGLIRDRRAVESPLIREVVARRGDGEGGGIAQVFVQCLRLAGDLQRGDRRENEAGKAARIS